MIKSQHDEGFNLIYKSLKHFDFNISETPSKVFSPFTQKIKPIPEDRFISYCLNLLQNYLKSKSDKYFVFWLLDNFVNKHLFSLTFQVTLIKLIKIFKNLYSVGNSILL